MRCLWQGGALPRVALHSPSGALLAALCQSRRQDPAVCETKSGGLMRTKTGATAGRQDPPADPIKVLADTRRTLLKLVANIDAAISASDQDHEDDEARAS